MVKQRNHENWVSEPGDAILIYCYRGSVNHQSLKNVYQFNCSSDRHAPYWGVKLIDTWELNNTEGKR
jgi:hypothetical protein